MDADGQTADKIRQLRHFSLVRLARCAFLAAHPMATRPAYNRLARQATLSIYCDCVELGAEAQARALLDSITRRSSQAAPPV